MASKVALDLLSLGSALLDEVDAGDRLLDARRERQLPLGRKRREREPAVGAASVVEHRVDLPGCLGVRIEEPHVDAVEHESRRPAAADHPATEHGDAARARSGVLSHGSASRSFARTSSGPSTRTFIASRIVTARSTSWRLVASTPRER